MGPSGLSRVLAAPFGCALNPDQSVPHTISTAVSPKEAHHAGSLAAPAHCRCRRQYFRKFLPDQAETWQVPSLGSGLPVSVIVDDVISVQGRQLPYLNDLVVFTKHVDDSISATTYPISLKLGMYNP